MASKPTSPDERTFPGQPSMPRGNEANGLSRRGLALSPKWFVLLALLLISLWLCLGQLFVVAVTYVGVADVPPRSLDRGWALLSTFAMAWAIVNVYWFSQLKRRVGGANLSNEDVSPRSAMLGHLAIATGCGLIALGIQAIAVARAVGGGPIVMDFSQSQQERGAPHAAAPEVVVGDAEIGRTVFSTTCITCHGPTGDGMPGLAPSLRGSPFMASADDAAIANVIRNGRAATDPQNKTKKLMPPRGGNPFLGDDQIAHLVAFVKALQTTAPAAAGGVADASAAPSAQLARWVVPPAADAPSGMVSLEDRSDIGDEATWRDRHESRRSSLVSVLTLASTGIHSLFLVGVMVVSSHVLLRGLRNESAAEEESWWSWSAAGWIAAAVVWLVIVLFCFVMV